MSYYIVDGDDLTLVADAIRNKAETSSDLEFPVDFVDTIENISTGVDNVIFGTFTTPSTGGDVQTINVPKTGGYIKHLIITPISGIRNSALDNIIYVKGILAAMLSQTNYTNPPTYTSTSSQNWGFGIMNYKSSSSSATTISNNAISATTRVYNTTAPSSTNAASTLYINSDNSFRLYVSPEQDTFGFIPNTEYMYVAIFSE